ncbi:MAG: peptidase [Pirellulales bacterium]|nr:peptidase [Pirellulales bacterium]
MVERFSRISFPLRVACVVAWLLAAVAVSTSSAEDIIVKLKDGRELVGGKGYTYGVAEQPRPLGEDVIQRILFVDDYMRRTFVSKRRWQEERFPQRGAPLRPVKIPQRAKHVGPEIASTGAILRVGPFDEHGRRIITMQGPRDPVDIVQGISELTPEWAKVEGITHVWETRIPTTSLPSDVLAKLLAKGPSADSVETQKNVARFYLQMERYEDAQKVLEAILAKHAGDEAVGQQIAPSLRQVRQLSAQRLVNELKRRRDVGQHALVWSGLESFPSDDVAGEILQEVRELLQEYQNRRAQGEEIIAGIKSLLAKLDDAQLQKRIEPIAKEIERELNMNTLDRMAAFRLAMNDESMGPGERLALAVSGWLLGSDAATANLPNALSAFEVRNLVRDYLVEPSEGRRDELLKKMASQEASAPRTVAGLLVHMKPPLADATEENPSGFYSFEVEGLPDSPSVRYCVQTPPGYDPHRTYPTIVTLHGAGSTPEQQIDWWAGSPSAKGRRNGQAGRQGYLVVAPNWTREGQRKYHYSAREHAAVLDCLRDACRRFSIDTDRVYLSGHAAGGDAAWDLGLAHPDLWAGVIPIVARAARYCSHYWENARYVPFYFVGGEKDGQWIAENATEFDRYLNHGFNATVVEYLGRGHEHYYDEIFRIFDWMGRCKRDFYPREFSCDSMRPFDNFFWWVEVEGMPERSVVDPANWSVRGKRPMNTQGTLTPGNGIRVRSGASRVTVWLSPKMVDFERRVKIVIDGKDVNRGEPFVKPNLSVMLEDARRRADRFHPFWDKVEKNTIRR